MIDLHCHLLPGLDDGPETMGEALAMAAVAEADGVRRIVATPHYSEADWASREEVQIRLAELRRHLRERGSRLEVLEGGEVLLGPDLPCRAAAGNLPTLHEGPYVLIEVPLFTPTLPNYGERVLAELQALGLRPILAHPERCAAFQNDLSLLAKLVERGVLTQINAGSISGAHGRRAQRVAREMLGRRLGQVIASDGHGPRDRPPTLVAAVREVARMVGHDEATAMIASTPAAVVAGEPIAVRAPFASPRRWRWWLSG